MTRMSLRTRIALIVAVVALGFAGMVHQIQRGFFYDQFLDLERKEARADLLRCRDAVEGEIQPVAVACGDWAAWDDLHTYASVPNEAFVAENLTNESMANTRWNGIWIVAADGMVRNSKARDNQESLDIAFPELPSDRFPLDHVLLRPRAFTEPVAGIVRTSRGPLLVASRQIIHSDFTGPPAGWVIVGRLLTTASLEGLAARTRVRFHAWDVDDPARDPRSTPAIEPAASADGVQPTWMAADDPHTLHVFGSLADVYGRPAIAFRADVPRDISKRGAESLRTGMVFSAVAGLSMVAVLMVLLAATVVRPLTRLRDHAVRIGRSDDLGTLSGVRRGDEIGALAAAFDEMTGRLRDSRERLADTARRAGVADVARGVLHNVGNVLTGVNVTVASIAEAHRSSRVDGLLRGVDLLTGRQDDLSRFLTEDPRGRLLPKYLAEAAIACREERAALVANSEALQLAVAHAAEIIARQGEFAAAPALVQRTDLEACVAGALALVEPALRRHSVTLERRLQSGCEVELDRAKLAQILVNLITNAKEALAGTDPALRRIVVRASVAEGHIRIEVEDVGEGIAPEHLARVFETGFSTKGEGRGLGLHFCSVTAVEMGGSLRAASDGPGRGAIFTLDLPASVANVAPAAPAKALGVECGA